MHEPTAAYGEVDFAISSQLETEIAQLKKKRTLEIRCLGMIEGGIPPPMSHLGDTADFTPYGKVSHVG